jgi:hypothetical protein
MASKAMALLEELVQLAREIRDELRERRGAPRV